MSANEPDDASQPAKPAVPSPQKNRPDAAYDPHQETDLFQEPDTDPIPVNSTPEKLPDHIGRYQIRGMLGQGAFGTVYLGFDTQLSRQVAIKVPRQNLAHIHSERFLQEARRVAQLRHPGIVSVFDIGEFDNRFCIVSDFVEGKSLSDWMAAADYSWQDAVRIIASLADALAHAHQHSTIHRDVKPSNVIVSSQGQPILLDFGLAISDMLEDQELPGIVAGTPSYMSPEQARGKGHRIDGRTDIYSLGVLLYRLVTRKLPFRAKEKYELLRQICDDEPQPIRQLVPEVPAELERICFKAMSKKMSDRHSTATDFEAELRHLLSTQGDTKQQGLSAEHPTQREPERTEAGSSQTPSSHSRESRLSEAERRQVTALFCELDESALDGELDPEEIRDLQLEIQRACSKISAKHGGYIASRETDGLLIYFGYPVSHEDAVHRSIRAGLEMLDYFRKFDAKFAAVDFGWFEFHIGIHTGIVVTEESETSESGSMSRYSVVGTVPKVSAGIARLADSGTILISSNVHRIVKNDFDTESIGAQKTRGLNRPIELFVVKRALDPNEIITRKSSSQRPLLGREQDLAVLGEAWRKVLNGQGQVAFISAPAGVGKSRLVSAFREQLRGSSQQFEAKGSAYHQNTPMYPVIQLLNEVINITTEDAPQEQLAHLEQFLEQSDVPVEEFVPVLADLLSIPAGGAYSAVSGSPEKRKQQTVEILTELLWAVAEQEPTLLVYEDLHWIDPTTLEILGAVIEHCVHSKVMLLLTFRPSFNPSWPVRSHITQLTLSPLPGDLTGELALAITGGRTLPAEVIDQIRDRTDGVPLYVEEMTKAILESEILVETEEGYELTGPIESVSIPETLNDSLMARLDRMGQARDVAQLASIAGREFSYQLLLAASNLNEESLKNSLKALVDAELVHQRGFFPRARFTFKHALIQDAAYESLLRSTRQEWHGRIADVLREQFPAVCESQPELLANHYTQSGREEEAIPFWSQAGLQARGHCAHFDAIHHFRSALSAINSLDDVEQREQLELQQLMPLGVSVISAKGYANPECGPVFERARVLVQKHGDPISQFHILWGVWAWRIVREEFDICMQLSEEAFAMDIVHQDDGIRMEAEFIPGLTKFYLGNTIESQEHCEFGLSLYDEERCRLNAQSTGQNSAITLASYSAINLWMLGYPERACSVIDEALSRARKLSDPYSLVFALHHYAWLHQYLRISDRIIECTREELEISEDQRFLFWIAESHLCRGYGEFLQNDFDTSIDSTKLGIKLLAQAGSPLSLCQFYSNLTECYFAKGELNAAREWVEKALEFSRKTNICFQRSEIFRLKAEILHASGGGDDAVREAYDESLKICRSQRAKSWELRTLTSMARFLNKTGQPAEAIESLETILDWFTEGRAYPDYLTAQTLLADLRQSR